MSEKVRCKALMDFVDNHPVAFRVSGGCGVTDRNDTPVCNSNSVWFKFCPFCGREIKSEYNGMRWEWWEEGDTLEDKLDKLLKTRRRSE